jgi:hypothetical protein
MGCGQRDVADLVMGRRHPHIAAPSRGKQPPNRQAAGKDKESGKKRTSTPRAAAPSAPGRQGPGAFLDWKSAAGNSVTDVFFSSPPSKLVGLEPFGPKSQVGGGRFQAFTGRPQAEAEPGLWFGHTGKAATAEALLDWAVREKIPEKQLIARVMHSHEFEGSDQARSATAAALSQQFRQTSLDERRLERQEEAAMQAEVQRQKDKEAARQERQKARQLWLHGHGPDDTRLLDKPAGASQKKKGDPVRFQTYDDHGNLETQHYPDPDIYGEAVRQQSKALIKDCNALIDAFDYKVQFDNENVRETHKNAAWYQEIALPRLGYTAVALSQGLVSVRRCKASIEDANKALSTINKGHGRPAATALNSAKEGLLEAKHWLAKMDQEKESADASKLGTLQGVSTVGDYATMAVPVLGQVGLSVAKNAAVRGSTMHSDPNASFGGWDFARESLGTVAGAVVPGPLKGAAPSAARTFVSNLAGGQVNKAISEGDISALGDISATDVLLTAAGTAHEQVTHAKAGGAAANQPVRPPARATGPEPAPSAPAPRAPKAPPAAALTQTNAGAAHTQPGGGAGGVPPGRGGGGSGGHPPGHGGGGKPGQPADPEIEKAFSTWDKIDLRTKAEVQAKPQAEKTIPAGPPPKPLDPAVKQKSQTFRKRSDDVRQRREQAAKEGKDPAKIKPKRLPKALKVKEYQKQVREAGRAEANAEAQKHAALVREQGPMTRKEAFDKVVAMRAFDAGAGIVEHQNLQREYEGVKQQLKSHPEAPAVDALQRENEGLRKEKASLARREKKGKLADNDRARLQEIDKTMAANAKKIEENPVTALRSRARALHDKLAISRLTDPDHPHAPSKGAPAGRGENTYAILQVIGPDGKLIAWGAGANTENAHAEENALVQIRQQIKDRKGGVPPGSRVEVVGDQVVCSEICKPALSKFATEHGVERVDGYTYHTVKPGESKTGEKTTASAKATARETTSAKAAGRELEEKHEPIYTREGGMQGGGKPTKAELHGQAQKKGRAQPPTAKETPHEPANPTRPAGKAGGAPPKAPAEPDKPSAKQAPKRPPQKPAARGKATAETEQPPQPAPRPLSPPGTAGTPKEKRPPAAEESSRPKAAKAKAKGATPKKSQPSVHDAGTAPTKSKVHQPERPTSPRGEKVTSALGKADAVLGAVRDYQQYKTEGKSVANALARSATTLAANLKGGPAAGIVNAANAYDNARKSGQGKVEAMATAIGTGGGGIIASKVAPSGPVGTAVNLANTAAQALGAPQGVQDATTGAAALVPSNIVSTTLTEGAHSYANLGTALVTGDTKALDKQVQGFQAGNAGPWLQGYAQVTGMVANMAAGDGFDKALNKAADTGKSSWADRVGSKGGDSLYELGQSKEAKSGKYGASVQGISMSLGMASDMIAGQSFEKALDQAAQAGKGSWADRAGSALGDVAWDATEKAKQLVGTDLPAAKQAIKDKWHKLWS